MDLSEVLAKHYYIDNDGELTCQYCITLDGDNFVPVPYPCDAVILAQEAILF